MSSLPWTPTSRSWKKSDFFFSLLNPSNDSFRTVDKSSSSSRTAPRYEATSVPAAVQSTGGSRSAPPPTNLSHAHSIAQVVPIEICSPATGKDGRGSPIVHGTTEYQVRERRGSYSVRGGNAYMPKDVEPRDSKGVRDDQIRELEPEAFLKALGHAEEEFKEKSVRAGSAGNAPSAANTGRFRLVAPVNGPSRFVNK